MKMDKQTAKSISIKQTTAFTDKKLATGKLKKTLAVFGTIDERDTVFTYAVNLRGGLAWMW